MQLTAMASRNIYPW